MKVERTTVHISDDTGRIAMQEKRTVGNAVDDDNTDTLLTRYIYSNHLQSAAMELDEAGAVISYEEYHPYGTTSYQATNAAIKAVAKRYRYTGKERDEESGLYYHGARYYVPWLGRWTASDPMESKYGGMSPYNYGFNNPVVFSDASGADPGDGDKKIASIADPNRPKMPAIDTSGRVDNARDVRSEAPILMAPIEREPVAVEKKFFSSKSQHEAAVFDREYAENQIKQAYAKEMSARAALDPYAFTLAQSPGVQAGMALAIPGYGETMGGLQLYSGLQTGNKTDIALGGVSVVLSGFASYKFAKQGGYAGSLTAADEMPFVASSGMKAGSGEVGVSLSIDEALNVSAGGAAKGGVAEGAIWAQKTFSGMFSAGGKFAGQTVDGVAGMLRSGTLSAANVPINVVVRNGQTFILNTRSSAALMQAGIPRSSWNIVNQTGVSSFESMLTGQLGRNGMINGTNTIRQSGTQLILSHW